MIQLVNIVGQSGTGKSFLERYLCEHGNYRKAISHTTREIREGEIHGVNYYFVSKEDFEMTPMVQSIEFAGNLYGMAESEIGDLSKNLTIVTEPRGVINLQNYLNTSSLEIKHIVVFLNYTNEECIRNLMLYEGKSEAQARERVEREDITGQWKSLNLKPNIELRGFREDNPQSVLVTLTSGLF